jgi:hypothetical protein
VSLVAIGLRAINHVSVLAVTVGVPLNVVKVFQPAAGVADVVVLLDTGDAQVPGPGLASEHRSIRRSVDAGEPVTDDAFMRTSLIVQSVVGMKPIASQVSAVVWACVAPVMPDPKKNP